MKKDISFLIPSKTENRDVEKFVNIAINSLNHIMTQNNRYSHEIVVYSKDEVKGENVVWVKEPADNDGAVKGFNGAYWGSCGDYVYTLIDDWYYHVSILKAVELLKSDTFKNRRFKVTTVNAPPNFDYSSSDMPTDRKYAVFGFVCAERQSVIKELDNHLANPQFKHRYWDNYLPYWIGEHGEKPLVCEDTYCRSLNYNYSFNQNDNYDREVFDRLVAELDDNKGKSYAN